MTVKKQVINGLKASIEFREDMARAAGESKGTYDDFSYLESMFWSDSRDLKEVLRLVRRNKHSEAVDLAHSLDTANRDYIPSELWALAGRSYLDL